MSDYLPLAPPPSPDGVVVVAGDVGVMGVVADGAIVPPWDFMFLEDPLVPVGLLCDIDPVRFPVCGAMPGFDLSPVIGVEFDGFTVVPLPCMPVPPLGVMAPPVCDPAP